jgi:diguanylate cyclase (GGDEF)-like protein
MSKDFDLHIQEAPPEFRRQYRLFMARRQQVAGLPVVAALLGALAFGSIIVGDGLSIWQVASLGMASLVIIIFVLTSRHLDDNKFSYFLAITIFCALEPLLLVQELYSNQYLLLINHVFAITLTSLSISWRTMLIGLFLLTTTDLILHQTILNLATPPSIQILYSNISILLGAGILAVRIQTVHRQADLAHTINLIAQTDPLTGLPNRRGMTRFIGEFFLKNQSQPLTMTYLDINNLKKINDQFGHQMGDSAIQLVANLLQQNLGENQFAARIGGDEFLIAGGESFDERERRLLTINENIKKRSQEELGLIVSTSFGTKSADIHSTDISDLVQLADEAQYQDKNS